MNGSRIWRCVLGVQAIGQHCVSPCWSGLVCLSMQEKARAGLQQLKQDKMTVLQYADAFESYLAQLGEYDESYYLTHFIFGLRPEVMRGVYIQQPESLLAAKNMAEKLELTHLMTSEHQEHTRKEKTNKATQHRGTQERRSGRLYQLVQMRTQKKTCRYQRQRSDSHTGGYIYAQKGAHEVSCPEIHGPTAVWRSMLRDLPQGDRAGYVRRQGSIMIVDLEALTHEKESKTSADATAAGMSMHPPSGRPRATQVCLCNRLLWRDRERKTRDHVRERQFVTGILETMVSPTSGGT